MALDYSATLASISRKAQVLVERHKRLAEAKALADARVAELEEQVEKLRRDLEQARLENEYLQIAATIAPSREQVENARAMVANLMRDIDRCITDLAD